MANKTVVGLVALVLLGVAGAGLYWWMQESPPAPAPAPSVPVAAAPPAAPPSAPAAPAIAHPIEADDAASAPPAPVRELPAPDKADSYVADALVGLLGNKPVLTFLSTPGFVARWVATVDNLDRPMASPRLWPVNPTPGRFVTVASEGGTLIGAENARRYAPFVKFVASVDIPRAAALYRHVYPLFQHAYEELGYPGKYFNDRMVQVIDHLLQTPDVAGPIKVKLTDVKGPIPSSTPWLRNEFEDPSLEERSSGQKILIRMGTENAAQLKAKLSDFRSRIAKG